MAKISILIGGHLCTAPRPQKEADVLASAGHNVTVYGVWFDSELVRRDRMITASKSWTFKPVLDFRSQYRFTRWQVRLKARLAKEIYQKTGRFSPYLLGYGAFSMLNAARYAKADLTIVHSELGLWVGSHLIDEGFCIGVDFEDWFSEDLPPQARIARPIAYLKVLEAKLLHNCEYCLTTSYALADTMARTYLAPKPKVVYNAFPWEERKHIDGQTKDRKNLELASIHWFSQTIGPGRGIEMLMEALPYLAHFAEIHLRGNYTDSVRQWLEPQIPPEWKQYVFIHSTVPSDDLLSRISEHDIGLALETADIKSRNFTVTNKLFQYLQAGLAISATNTTGQREIFSAYSEIGILLHRNTSRALASAINGFLNSPTNLSNAKAASLNAAQTTFNWECEASKIAQLAELVLTKV